MLKPDSHVRRSAPNRIGNRFGNIVEKPPNSLYRVFIKCVTRTRRSDPRFVANVQDKWLTRPRSKRIEPESSENPREPLEIPPDPLEIRKSEAK